MPAPKRAVGVGRDPSKVRNCLELSDDPTVGAGGHQHHVVHNRMLAVDGFAAIQDLIVVFGSVVKFDHVAFRGVEHGVDFVALVRITGRMPLVAAVLTFVLERGIGVACKKSVQRFGEFDSNAAPDWSRQTCSREARRAASVAPTVRGAALVTFNVTWGDVSAALR